MTQETENTCFRCFLRDINVLKSRSTFVQLEDAEFATGAAVKSRKGMELELGELQQQLDAVLKTKQEIETRYSQLNREKNDLQSHLEENEEDTNEVVKKYKALVQQVGTRVDFVSLTIWIVFFNIMFLITLYCKVL